MPQPSSVFFYVLFIMILRAYLFGGISIEKYRNIKVSDILDDDIRSCPVSIFNSPPR